MLKALVVVFATALVVAGLAAMLLPLQLAAKFAVDAHGLVGLSTLRGVVGGLLGSLGAMMLLGVFSGEPRWFRSTALVFALVAVGRVFGFAFDGVSADTLLPFSVEVAGMVLALAAHRRLPTQP